MREKIYLRYYRIILSSIYFVNIVKKKISIAFSFSLSKQGIRYFNY